MPRGCLESGQICWRRCVLCGIRSRQRRRSACSTGATLMISTNDGTFKGSPTAKPAQSGGLLSRDELALPALCGQTGKPFLMVLRRQGRGVLELIRAVVIDPPPSVRSVPVAVPLATPTYTPSTFCSGCGHKLGPTSNFCTGCGRKLLPQPDAHAGPSGRVGEGMSEDPAVSFQALTLSARIHIGSLYHGCPYCHATGYFHCGCGMFSCWNRQNRKPHLDHTDVWCAACRSWKCTSEKADDDSLSELTAYAARENTVDLRSRIAPGSTGRDQINHSTSIRGYLK